jgi:hypothetical protein
MMTRSGNLGRGDTQTPSSNREVPETQLNDQGGETITRPGVKEDEGAST